MPILKHQIKLTSRDLMIPPLNSLQSPPFGKLKASLSYLILLLRLYKKDEIYVKDMQEIKIEARGAFGMNHFIGNPS